MQLQPGERSILAYFTNQEDAVKAITQLSALGFNDARMDKISSYTHMSSAMPYSLSARTAASDNPEHYRSFGPLLAAGPMVSGYANAEIAYTHMITLIANNSQIDTAISILRDNGARV